MEQTDCISQTTIGFLMIDLFLNKIHNEVQKEIDLHQTGDVSP
jgi:hypothetical protein